jgi:hypothetical protein
MTATRILVGLGLAALAGCGRQVALRPAPGQLMPLKPLMAKATPTVEQLLTPPSYARPNRVDELVRRSQPRSTDPFDLPPPSGGNAPTLPAGTDPGPVSNETGTATPK